MPLFKVTIIEEWIKTINVEAPTKADAYSLVWEEGDVSTLEREFNRENIIEVKEIK